MGDQKYFDKALDAVLFDAVPIAEKQIMEELNAEISNELNTSKNHDKKMRKIIKSYERKFSIKKRMPRFRVAVILLAILLASASVSIVSVDAWRLKIFNLFVHKNDTHSDVRFNELPQDQGRNYEIQGITFEYMPEGFTAEVRKAEPENIFVRFSNDTQYFSFNLRLIDGSFAVDTEDADSEKIILGQQEALLSKKENRYILLWNVENNSYVLSGNVSKELLIKIGESIKK